MGYDANDLPSKNADVLSQYKALQTKYQIP